MIKPSLSTLFIVSVGYVGASLYPTQPIANSVFNGGAYNNVTWIDNDAIRGPSLTQLGRLRIDMWQSDIKHLATLASDVDPQQMSQIVFIQPNWSGKASNYVIRFRSDDPPVVVYTADFSITNMTGNRSAHSDEKIRQPLEGSSASAGLPASNFPSQSNALGGGNNDLVTVTMEMPDSSAAPFPRPTSAAAVAANDALNGGRHVRRPSMQFNFVFVLFPALFGLALAL